MDKASVARVFHLSASSAGPSMPYNAQSSSTFSPASAIAWRSSSSSNPMSYPRRRASQAPVQSPRQRN
ncbi:hypothetical protein CF326_g7396 [Tilletia indica]|uniref:Uncharacterized protein n=1 Tax=Tilletia indica TaxID=43049 RepID=A0A8T8SEJ0_9BASI|nr:hypothetical protein CF326_g7396 [Tilletia indica]KAE8238442.1 hypothetical protein A4X13_0g8507 [Tilletia indica]